MLKIIILKGKDPRANTFNNPYIRNFSSTEECERTPKKIISMDFVSSVSIDGPVLHKIQTMLGELVKSNSMVDSIDPCVSKRNSKLTFLASVGTKLYVGYRLNLIIITIMIRFQQPKTYKI